MERSFSERVRATNVSISGETDVTKHRLGIDSWLALWGAFATGFTLGVAILGVIVLIGV
jgi:hypothetical protein